jgi:neprilysin
LCLTPNCVRLATKILDSLDLSVEPCNDFYHFACGKFVKETKIPDDKVSVNTLSSIGDNLKEQLRTIISEPVNESESAPFRLAKELFNACMNKGLIEERDAEPMLKMYKFLGGWPVVEGGNWDDKAWTWAQSVKDFRKYGYSTDYFFSISIVTDFKKSTQRIIFVSTIHKWPLSLF